MRIDGEFEIQPKGIEQGVRVFDLGGIAGDYQLALTRPASVMLAPLKAVAVTWNSLRAEPGSSKATQARLVRMSADAAEIAPSAGLQRNDDLRVTINGAHPYLAHAPMYAKVIEVTNEVAVLRFTALPLEAASFLSGVMQVGPWNGRKQEMQD